MSYWKSIFDNTKWEKESAGDPGGWVTDHWELGDQYDDTNLVPTGDGYLASKMRYTFSSPADINVACIHGGYLGDCAYNLTSGQTFTFSSGLVTVDGLMFNETETIVVTNIEFWVPDIEETLAEAAIASDEIEFFSLSDAIEETAVAGDSIEVEMEYNPTLTETATAGDPLAGAREMDMEPITETAIASDEIDGFNWTTFLSQYEDLLITRFYFTLTGDADGETDVEMPISSFNCRLRSGDPTYLQVVVPGVDQSAAIAARPNGDMLIEMDYLLAGVSQHREEIVRVDLENVRIDQGSKNKSITLTGHRTVTHTGKVADLKHVSYTNADDGDYTIRGAIDMYLRPGDTARYDGDTFTVGSISIVVGSRTKTMEVSE